MSRRLRLFPLPGVVLLPGTLLPLHIFEPRYRALVADALEDDRTIGMAMWKPASEGEDVNPPIHAVGGAGEIVDSESLEDGRYNILLEARFRFRVLREELPNPYRVAVVEEVPSVAFAGAAERDRTVAGATALFREVAGELSLPPLPPEAMSDERLASEMALRLRYDPGELQQLLETDAIRSRFETLVGRMLEWKRRLEFLGPFRPADLDPRRN